MLDTKEDRLSYQLAVFAFAVYSQRYYSGQVCLKLPALILQYRVLYQSIVFYIISLCSMFSVPKAHPCPSPR